jgi:hypothetical protein
MKKKKKKKGGEEYEREIRTERYKLNNDTFVNGATPLFTNVRKLYCSFALHKLMEDDFKSFVIYSKQKWVLHNSL